MYDAVVDSYCYEGTTVLKNIPDIRDQASLNEFEVAITAQRADEALPEGSLDAAHYYAIHFNLERLVPERFMQAMIASFEKDDEQLAVEIKELLK
jgi:hypothetical protein